ncbi:MAG: sensor histidine kinase [Acidimicrobiales bacterium]
MSTLTELARAHTSLTQVQIGRLARLVAYWSLAADLCFNDLLLFAPVAGPRGREGEQFVVLAQVRPATGQTLYESDLVGAFAELDDRPILAEALAAGEILEGRITVPHLAEAVHVQAIPVRVEGRVAAVISRDSAPSKSRSQGELERAYLAVFGRVAAMIAAGEYPFPGDELDAEDPPRVGDGAVLLDAAGAVTYASPNARSNLHRIGLHTNPEGARLSEVGIHDTVVAPSFRERRPAAQEVSSGFEEHVLAHCTPLLEGGEVVGGLLLLRDISKLKRLDRLLMSKDATIREIHHRVKNNLQTISSLLRLQARRLASPEAKSALEESVRRIGSIALVHESLARDAGDDVSFLEIARPIVRMVEESLLSPEREVHFKISGDPIMLPATVATPLAVVLNELLQNAVDHAYPPGAELAADAERRLGLVDIRLTVEGDELVLLVADDGVGLPESFGSAPSSGLGLSIVRALVTSELGGSIDIRPRAEDQGGGTRVELRAPLPDGSPAELG